MDGIFSTRFVDPYLRFHKWVYEWSDGRVGKHSNRIPALLITTTGRKSGLARTNGLTYCTDRGDLIVVASNGGSDRPPAWLLNLQADPHVRVRVGREVVDATARVATPPGAGPSVAEGEPDQPRHGASVPPQGDRPLRRLSTPYCTTHSGCRHPSGA